MQCIIPNLTGALPRPNARLDLLTEMGLDHITREVAPLGTKAAPIEDMPQILLNHLNMPNHHDVRAKNVVMRRLHGALAATGDQ